MKPKSRAASPTLVDLRAEGKARRKRLPRRDQSRWNPSLRREDPMRILARAVEGRLPELLPERRARMLPSPFAFFRGAAALMAADLALLPHTGIHCHLCGDAHVQNLGAYAGEDGQLVFDINDFDETIVAPFEWDLKRMATSLLLAAGDASLKPSATKTAGRLAASAMLASYSSLITRLAGMPILEVARYRVHPSATPVADVLHRALHATPLGSREELMQQGPDGGFRFRTLPHKLHPLSKAAERDVLASLKPYLATLGPERQHFMRQFTPRTATFKIVGVGSVGLRDYCVYLEGNGSGDPLFLQIKQETASCYAPYLGRPGAGHMGERVVHGQRAMQFQSDPLLGWTTLDGRDFLVRQLSDHKATLDATSLHADELHAYAAVCGEVLAHGHARSGFPRQIAGYLGSGPRFAEAILAFAKAYASQTVTDWKTFRRHR